MDFTFGAGPEITTGGGGTGAFDTSNYRQNTYGPPTHYCDCTRSLASNGAGTLGDPWNCNQAMANPVAGNIVGWLPISECVNSTPVSLAHTTDGHSPAFQPANSGTLGNPIVHVTKYAGSWLVGQVGKLALFSDTRRTELRHDGSAPTIVGGFGGSSDTGCAIVGPYNRNYITMDGFCFDMVHAYIEEDSGMIRPDLSTGAKHLNFAAKGTDVTVASNCVMYRPNGCHDTVLSNFFAWYGRNDGSASATPQQFHFSDQYGDQNSLIEHFDVSDFDGPLRLKGTYIGTFNYSTIRYGIISDCGGFLKFNDLDPSNLTTVHNVLCYTTKYNPALYAGDALYFSAETSTAQNILIHHCTFAKVQAADPNLNGCFYVNNFTSFGLGSNTTIRDCIFDIDSGTFGNMVALDDTRPTTLDYNYYTKNGSSMTFVYNGASSTGLAAWQAASSRDANSAASNTSPFTNRAANDFTTTGAASTMSSTGGAIGAYGDTTETIGVVI